MEDPDIHKILDILRKGRISFPTGYVSHLMVMTMGPTELNTGRTVPVNVPPTGDLIGYIYWCEDEGCGWDYGPEKDFEKTLAETRDHELTDHGGKSYGTIERWER